MTSEEQALMLKEYNEKVREAKLSSIMRFKARTREKDSSGREWRYRVEGLPFPERLEERMKLLHERETYLDEELDKLAKQYLPQLFGYDPNPTNLQRYANSKNLVIAKKISTVLANSPLSSSVDQIHKIQDSIVETLDTEIMNLPWRERGAGVKEDVLQLLYNIWIGGPTSYTFDKFLMLLGPKKLGGKALRVLEGHEATLLDKNGNN